MAQIDTDAEIDSIRLKEQAAAPAAVDTGYWALLAKEGGLYHEDDNQVEAGPLGTGLTPGGRLTLTTAVPVTTADVTAAATLYYTPYLHNMIELFDGARWIPVPFAEVSLSLVGYTASKPYDIWGYLAAGTVALESTIWTDGTTRATALAYQDGRYVKAGTTTRRYLGTIYINSSGAQTDDSLTKRCVWNYYNRVYRSLYLREATSHSYNGAARSWNNDAAVRVTYVCGVLEDTMNIGLSANIDPIASHTVWVSLGFDVTNAQSLDTTYPTRVTLPAADALTDYYSGLVMPKNITTNLAVGYHFWQAVEATSAAITLTSVVILGGLYG